jgi:hypothetical protein
MPVHLSREIIKEGFIVGFILRIFFMGLIAFVPSRDGKELTVLLVETRPGHIASDGSLIVPHQPMLLARAADCWGHCGIRDAGIAGFFFPQDSSTHANQLLSAALGDGAAWTLDGSDLSILDAERDPAREVSDKTMDFSSIADLGGIVPSAGIADPELLASRPPKRLIVARLRLRSGKVWTYRLVQPCDFKILSHTGDSGDGDAASPRPLADWVAAEFEISDDTVEIVENRFGGQEPRTIRLAPQDGLVELTLMNIPPPPAQQSGDESHQEHQPAAHFEMYYDLALTPPSPKQRPVPHIADQNPSSQKQAVRSGLIEALKLDDPKGFYERILCPVVRLSEGESP